MTRFGRYEIQAELGRGGFGRVYRAFDPTVNRMVAIKSLNAGGDPELLKRFRNEAAAAGKLRHRNIIIIHDFGEQDGEPFIVMELLEGMDLQRIISSGRSMTLLEKMKIMDQIAEGLHHAHTKGVVHRDVKPANMMLLPDASVKIMDFGIALLTQAAGTRLTRTGTIPGTLRYMAPEQFKGSNNDPVSDIFSYAVMYYELLSGRHPFDGPTQPAIMFKIMSSEPPAVREAYPECPDLLEQVLQRALTKDRDLRYQTLEDIQFDLRPLMLELQHEGSRDLVTLAEQQAASGDWESAQASVRQALELDPRNREAVLLRRRLQQEQQRVSIKPKVDSLIRTGRQMLTTGEFQEAVSSLESALNLDRSSQEAASLLDTARSALEQKKSADQLAADAQRALQAGDITQAYRKAGEALQRDPTNARAGNLMERVRREIESREQARKLEHNLTEAREALLREAFEPAIETLVAMEAEFPHRPEVVELLEQARRDRAVFERRKQLDARMGIVKAQLAEGRFGAATPALEALQADFPESSEVGEMLASSREGLSRQRRAEHLERLQREVNANRATGNYDVAIEMLVRGMSFYPGEAVLEDLLHKVHSEKASADRHSALEEASASAEKLWADGRFSEALGMLSGFEQRYGVEPGLEELRGRIAADEALRKAVATARQLLNHGELEQAIEGLERAARQNKGDPELEGLLAQARAQFEERRRKAEADRLQERAEAEKARSSLQRVLSAPPGELSARMEAHVREFGEEPAFGPLRERLRKQAQSLAALNRLGFDGQRKAIEVHVREFGDDPACAALRARLDARDQSLERLRTSKPMELAAAIEAHIREFGDDKALGRARSLAAIAKLDFDEQRKAIEAHVREFGDDPSCAALRTRLDARDKSLERLRTSKPTELAAAIEAHFREFGDEAALVTLRDRLRKRNESMATIQALYHEARYREMQAAVERHAGEYGEESVFDEFRQASLRARPETATAVPVIQREREKARPSKLQESKKPGWLVPAGAGAVLLLAGGVFVLTRESKPPQAPPPTPKAEVVKPAETPIVTTPPVTTEPPKEIAPPAEPPAEVAKGKLTVTAGIEGVEVFIDEKLYGRTNAQGRFEATVEAKTHDVRLSKPGYSQPAANRMNVAANSGSTWNATMKALDVPLQLEGGTVGAQVRLNDGRLLGAIGPDGRLYATLPPGEYRVLLSKDQFNPAQFTMRLEPGRGVKIGPPQTVLSPAKVDPQAQVAQEWEKLKNSQDLPAIEEFLRRNRNSPLAAAAEQRADDLRWASLNRRDAAALREFVRRSTNSRHAREATDSLRGLEWAATDKNNSGAIEEFRRRYPDTDEAGRALRELERIRGEAKKAEDDRGKAAQATDRNAVLAIIERHARAFEQKSFNEISATYPSLDTRQLRASLSDKNNTLRMTLRPVGDVEIRGDEASVACERVSTVIVRDKAQPARSSRVQVSLRRTGNSWVIQRID